MPTGLGVDIHPYYQRGATFPGGAEYAWIKMADGARIYTKTVGGVVYTADAHAARLRAAGVPFGGYCYAQPGDGAAEARLLWSECVRLGGTGLAPAVDIESDAAIHIWSKTEATDHGRAFCSQLRAIGVRPAVYMNTSMAQLIRPYLWPENPVIWIARYGAKPEAPGSAQYLGRYDVHQYRSDGTLPGSAGAVDWNQAYTSAHLLSRAPTPTMEELMRMAEPRDLPETTGETWGRKTFPVEVGAIKDGGNSSVVANMWLTLVSAWGGTTDYAVWASNDKGERIAIGGGSSSPDVGTLKDRGFAVIEIPKGTRLLTLTWLNKDGAQAGYAFPQVGQ